MNKAIMRWWRKLRASGKMSLHKHQKGQSLIIIVFAFIGILAFAFATLMDIPSLGLSRILLLSMGVGILAGVVHLFINLIVSLLSFKRGLDPDNTAIPSLAILGDVVTILYFMLFVGWVT